MEFAVGIVSSIFTPAVQLMISPIKNKIKYISNHENNVRTLKDQVESLKNARERVQHSVDAARRNGEEIEDDVSKWQSTVNQKITDEVEKVIANEEKAKKKCFIGLCPNLWARYKHSVKAEEEAKVVAELLEHGKFDRVSYHVAPQVVTAAFVKGFEAFESRTVVLNGIMGALKDDSINILGVHGMGGVGKTTLAKEVARQVKEGKLFDSVVVATVTQTLDVEKIQNQIAELLGLKFDEQSKGARSLRLRERLKTEKKVLVVLDDIWERLDLEEVGIPVADEHKGCKILLTSRDLNVLSNGMNSEKNFVVGLLNEEETWTLFKKMAGGDFVESFDLKPTAIEVAKKCAGLPIAIATVARALRNKRLFEWKNALCELKRPSLRNIKGVTKEVHSAIELSYNYLEDEEVKLTFLLCSLLGHNSLIEDLLKYVIGMGLFHGINTVEEARNRVLTVVSNLKASCLLLDSYNDERFDIHDVVWDVGLSIALTDHHMFVVKDGEVLDKWPGKERMDSYRVLNFRYPRITTELPDVMEGKHLSLFCIDNVGPLKIPANLFRGTERLKVLHFTGMHFSSLPISISLLTNLHTLCLNECALQDISVVGKLKNLEILSLARSVIEALPKEIAQLTRLRLLDLSYCSKLQLIPPNVLSSLCKLEELYMDNSFVQWEGEVHDNGKRNASLDELKHLPHLTALYVHIPDAQIIPKHLFSETLERYRILIGYERDWSSKYEYSRTLKLKIYTSIYVDHAVRMLLKKTEDLYLDQLNGIKNVLDEFNDGEDLPHLKNLHICNGLEVQYITRKKFEFAQLKSMTLEGLPKLISFCSEDKSSNPVPLFDKQLVFPCLESLRLSSINAERIWHSPLSENCTFAANLKSLTIEGCGKLEHLLSPSIARSLVQLTHFKVADCQRLRGIISTEEIEEEKVVICFPQLDSLKIVNLRSLVNFCAGNYNIEFPALKVLEVDFCPELMEFIREPKIGERSEFHVPALFNDKVALPSLERMSFAYLNNVKMIFDKQLLAGSFCKLKAMIVNNCDALLTIFSSNIFGAFQSLENLDVYRCNSLEMIFEVGGLNIREPHVVHSQLRSLYISSLPALKHVWNKDPQGILSFQNLRIVDLYDCENLKSLFPVSIAKDLQQLENLTLSGCGVEEIVFSEEGLEEPIGFEFAQLSFLALNDLRELKCFYRGQHTLVWPMLKKLETDHSTLLKIVCNSQHLANRNDPPECTTGQPRFLTEKVIPILEELRLTNPDDISKICDDGQFPADFFHHIKVFQLCNYSRGASAILPSHFLQRFCNLESLKFSNCNFKEPVSSEGDDAQVLTDVVTLKRIKKLTFYSCKFLKHIWEKKDSELGHILQKLEILEVKWCGDLTSFGPSLASFQNLTTLEVAFCKMMMNLATPSVVQNLVQLTTMKIAYCSEMTEIIANEGGEATPTYEINFSKLQCLELSCLQSLASFSPGNYTINFPSLQELMVTGCPRLKIFSPGVLSAPQLQRVKGSRNDRKGCWAGDLNTTIQHLYNEKVGYRGIDELKLSDTSPELMEIWNGRNPHEILDFKSLASLEFCNCSSLKYIFTLSRLLSLKHLSYLVVKECSTLKEVVMEQEIEEEATTDNFIFPNLRYIKIESCSSLRSFYLGSGALEIPRLGSIEITDCPKMTTFASSFPKDEEKEISADGSEKRVGHGDLNIEPFFTDKVLCPRVRRLTLSSTDIQMIWHDQQLPSSLCIQNLEWLSVKGCHDLKYLFPFYMVKHLVQLVFLHISDCKMMEEVIFKEGSAEEESPMLFPKLKSLWLEDLSKLSRFCYENYLEFPCLISLKLINCPLLETFISKPVNAGHEPQQFDQNAQGYQLEVDVTTLFNEKVALPSLKRLTIKGMGKCRKIWQDQLTVNSFCELKYILVESCEKLSNIFPFNMMERLEKLEELQIVNCDSLEEIFEPQAITDNQSHGVATTESIVEETMAKFVFPSATYLRLENLPNLKCFYSRAHATEWPSLKKMKVVDCQNVQIFASECPGFGETQGASQVEISNQPPLFRLNEVTFPILEKLKLKQSDAWHGQVLSTECFSKLKVLKLKCIPEKATDLACCFIQSLPNLEKLLVKDSSFCQIFQFEGLSDDDQRHAALTRLSELRLSKLPELTHLWKEEFQPGAAFSNLKLLEVLDCVKLKTLVPSNLVSFNNLTTLEVSGCHGLVKLVTCSTATSLMQLKRLSITDCNIIEEIIACDADEIQGAIVFSQLRYLKLSRLPSLSSFCSKNHNFEFPALLKVIVHECPKLEIFCQGDLTTPKLQQVLLPGDEDGDEQKRRWEGDLKTTIRKLFDEMNVHDSEVTEVTLELPTLQ